MSTLEPCDCTTLLGAGVCGPLKDSPNSGLVGCQARTPAAEMLAALAALPPRVRLIYIDSHVDDYTGNPAWLAAAGAKLAAALDAQLFGAGYTGHVLISAPKLGHLPFLAAALSAAAAGGHAGHVHYTIDNEGAAALPALLSLGTPNIMFAYGQPSIVGEIGLVCTQLASGMADAASLYRQRLL